MADAELALLLARIQFAFTVSFHFIFPVFSIGLASFLAVLEGLWLKTKNDVYLRLFEYWLKIFALTFAMGVRDGRRFRHCDVLSIRHQLVAFL